MALTFASGAYIEQLASAISALSVSTAAIGVWFRRNGRPAGNQPLIFGKQSAANQGFGMYLEMSAGADQDKVGFFGTNSSAQSAFSFLATTKVAFDGYWHLASCNLQMASGAQCDGYMDGGGKTSANTSRAWDVNNHPIRFSRSLDNFWGSFDGSLAHSFFYNETLTDGEHKALACGVSPLLIRPHALLLYYPMMAPAPTHNLVNSIFALPVPSTSGTLTHTDGPRQEPADGGAQFDPLWFSQKLPAPASTIRSTWFYPVRSARRR